MAAGQLLTQQTLDITPWDPSSLAPDAVIALIGARHSGKSTMLVDIMYHMRHRLDLVVGFSPTDVSNGILSAFLPQSCIHTSFNEGVVNAVIKNQQRAKRQDKANRRIPGYRPRTMRVGVIMDDIVGDNDGKKKSRVTSNATIDTVVRNGRHVNMFMCLCLQYLVDIPPSMRRNLDYVIAFDTNSAEDLDALRREFFGMFAPSDFRRVFRACVGNYTAIVLDVRKSRGEAPGTGVHFYRAPYRKTDDLDGPLFRVGRPVFWRLNDYFYRDGIAAEEVDPLVLRGIAGPTGEEGAGDGSGKKGKAGLVVRRVPAEGGGRARAGERRRRDEGREDRDDERGRQAR